MSLPQSVICSTCSSMSCTFPPRFHPVFLDSGSHFPIQKYGNGSLIVGNRSLQYFGNINIAHNTYKTKRNFVAYCNLPQGIPFPDSWKGWLLGMLFTVAIPLATNKWGTILKWTQKIGATVQTVEDIVEAVEDVAEKVEKIAEDIIDDLPEGKLKSAVSCVEKAAEEIAKDAHLIDNIIDQAQDVEEKFEAFIEESSAAVKEAKVKEI